MQQSNLQKYLPSKKFTRLFLILIGIILLILIITSLISSRKSYTTAHLVSSQGTVSDIISRDSNNNDIPDWEESLWGLDPKADGVKNKQIIDQKKAAANITPDTSTPENETDKFSQELISTILALRQTGQITPEIMASISQAIENTTNTKHTNAKTYSIDNLKVVDDSTSAKSAYKARLKSAIDQYSNIDLGSEMTIITSSFDGNEDVLKKLQPLAEAYITLGKQIIAIPTPQTVSQNALDLANASNQMGTSLMQTEKLYSDALSGMVGIDDYIQASNLSDAATKTLRAYFGS